MIIVASQKDGRVVPWFSEGNIPKNFVEIPISLYDKYRAGEIKDGFELAKKALAVKAGYGAEAQEKPAIKIPVSTKKEAASKEVAEEKSAPAAVSFPEIVKMRT